MVGPRVEIRLKTERNPQCGPEVCLALADAIRGLVGHFTKGFRPKIGRTFGVGQPPGFVQPSSSVESSSAPPYPRPFRFFAIHKDPNYPQGP